MKNLLLRAGTHSNPEYCIYVHTNRHTHSTISSPMVLREQQLGSTKANVHFTPQGICNNTLVNLYFYITQKASNNIKYVSFYIVYAVYIIFSTVSGHLNI